MTIRLRTGIAVGTAAALGVFGAVCSDDDNDGNQEIEIPGVTAPEVDSPVVDDGG